MKKKVLTMSLFVFLCFGLILVSGVSKVEAAGGNLDSLIEVLGADGNVINCDDCTNLSSYVAKIPDGGTLKLKKDITDADSLGDFTIDPATATNITLDLNNFKISTESNNIAVTIGSNNSSLNVTIKGGKITSSQYVAVLVKSGTAILENVEIEATVKNLSAVQVGLVAGSAGSLKVESGTKITAKSSDDSSSASAIGVFGNGSKLEVNGGEITGDSFAISGNGSKTTNSTITINDGKLIGKKSAAIYHPQTGTLTISGGDITGGFGVVARQGTVTINSGAKITATGTDDKVVGDVSVELKSGAAVIVDNQTNGYAGTAKAVINGGEFSAIADEALVSYGNDESDFEVNGGKYNAPFNSEFINEGKLEVGISKGEGTDTTYYIGADAVTAIKEAAKDGTSVVEVFQGDLEIKGAVDGFTIKNSGEGKVSVNGTSVAKNENVVVDNPDSASKDNTPKTGMIDYTVFIAMVTAVVALGGIYTVKKLVK